MTADRPPEAPPGDEPDDVSTVESVITDFNPSVGRVHAKFQNRPGGVTFDVLGVRLLNDGFVSLSKGRKLEITLAGDTPTEFRAL